MTTEDAGEDPSEDPSETSDPSQPCISIRGLSRRLPSGERMLTILDSVDLEVPRGQFVAILGPSGSGKSTLLALMAGLDRASEGSIQLDGVALEDLSEDQLALLRRDKVGFVFQSFHLLQNQTARENVLLPLELSRPGDSRAELEARADELLEAVGLGDRGHHYPAQLSGGEQQRVALARAFAAEPPILLADEPTGNLDGATGRSILQLIDGLRRENTTMVLVTHDPQVAEMADRAVHLRDGRIERDEVRGEPRTESSSESPSEP